LLNYVNHMFVVLLLQGYRVCYQGLNDSSKHAVRRLLYREMRISREGVDRTFPFYELARVCAFAFHDAVG